MLKGGGCSPIMMTITPQREQSIFVEKFTAVLTKAVLTSTRDNVQRVMVVYCCLIEAQAV